jgi:hypothetical protein
MCCATEEESCRATRSIAREREMQERILDILISVAKSLSGLFVAHRLYWLPRASMLK